MYIPVLQYILDIVTFQNTNISHLMKYKGL